MAGDSGSNGDQKAENIANWLTAKAESRGQSMKPQGS